MKHADTFRFDYDLGKGEQEFEANVYITTETDTDWGADADGNRGITKTLIEEVEVESVTDDLGNVINPIPKEMEEFIKENAELD